MQEYWEIYMKPVDGKPASVLFNAGVSMEIEELKHLNPTVAFVKVKLKQPKKDGLLHPDEADEIAYLEDKLEAGILKFRLGKYVGRIISDGYVTFIYYVPFTYNWQEFLDYATDEHGHYEIQSGYQEDSAWNFYRRLLYPNAKEWQIIQNHKTCDALKAQGDKLHTPRAIEHRLYWGEGCDKERLRNVLEQEGFKILTPFEDDKGSGVSFFRIDTPFYSDIDELTLHLIDLLEANGATYDGWETSVVKR